MPAFDTSLLCFPFGSLCCLLCFFACKKKKELFLIVKTVHMQQKVFCQVPYIYSNKVSLLAISLTVLFAHQSHVHVCVRVSFGRGCA